MSSGVAGFCDPFLFSSPHHVVQPSTCMNASLWGLPFSYACVSSSSWGLPAHASMSSSPATWALNPHACAHARPQELIPSELQFASMEAAIPMSSSPIMQSPNNPMRAPMRPCSTAGAHPQRAAVCEHGGQEGAGHAQVPAPAPAAGGSRAGDARGGGCSAACTRS